MATQGPETKTGTDILFPTFDFAQRFNWPLRTFALPRELKMGMQMGRATLRVKEFCSPESCIVYLTTDAHVQVISQEEIESGILCEDKPPNPNQKRKTVKRTLSIDQPTLLIGRQMAVDYTGHEGEYASFCLRAKGHVGSLIPTHLRKTRIPSKSS